MYLKKKKKSSDIFYFDELSWTKKKKKKLKRRNPQYPFPLLCASLSTNMYSINIPFTYIGYRTGATRSCGEDNRGKYGYVNRQANIYYISITRWPSKRVYYRIILLHVNALRSHVHNQFHKVACFFVSTYNVYMFTYIINDGIMRSRPLE
jgi:hypothetical protein